MALDFKKISNARVDLNHIVDRACYQGLVTVITIGKTEKAAVVPLSMVAEYQALRGARHADTIGQDTPRTTLPQEVAHSHAPTTQLADAFEQPPEDDGYIPTDEEFEEFIEGMPGDE